MNIIIAGAGTAGWLAALYANKKYPDADVIVVHDDKTPIIGVGEGTTSHFTRFMNSVDISTEELIQNCEATIKNSIKFTNWSGDDTHYYHNLFSDHHDEKCTLSAISMGVDVEKTEIGSLLCEDNKIPLERGHKRFTTSNENTQHGMHFNAKKLAEYLENVATRRGVKIIIGKITDVFCDDNDYVRYIVLDTKRQIKTDFVFDCTGFARVFVDKIYKSPFISYEKSLPVKRAMPFFLDKCDATPPFTEAIAMKYGWMWKIPVGNRYGCGYVFDSDFITDEQAYEEICEITNQKPHVPKKISFKPGYYTKPFNKNTLSLGLSHGFLEPLEATSLMVTVQMLDLLPKIGEYNQSRIDAYNDFMVKKIENIVDMIYIHYLTPRSDTVFWKNFDTNNVMLQHTLKTINKIKNVGFSYPHFIGDLSPFGVYSFVKCMSGVNIIGGEFIENNKNILIDDKNIQNIVNYTEKMAEASVNHDEYLKYWTNNSKIPLS